jgi:putative transposase
MRQIEAEERGTERVLARYRVMSRQPRVVVVDVAHHVTQRGNGRQFILANDAERLVYLDLLRQGLRGQELSVVGYCLMSNHVHLVVIPRRAEALAETFKQVHGRYAAYWNVSHASSGHVWQGRFYSCPMDLPHLWTALRYAELNPVRAGMAAEAAAWPWSSAAAHCGKADPDACLEMTTWRKAWSEASWGKFLEEGETESELLLIRRCTRTGRPLGREEFTKALEERTLRRLTPGKGGRPRKPLGHENQSGLALPT